MFNLDKMFADKLRPIDFQLNGKTYKIGAISGALFEDIQSLLATIEDGANVADVHAQALAKLTGSDESDFADLDIRLTIGALTFIMDKVAGVARGRGRVKKQ